MRPGKLKGLTPRRKAVVITPQNLVAYRFFDERKPLPLVIEPVGPYLNLPAWVHENRDQLREKLWRYGALLFRNFEKVDTETFQQTVTALSGELLSYLERSSPRHAVADRVYTSTDYPPEESIFLHNEQSYNLNWCGVISFYCDQPAREGGQTPIADTRKILARLDPTIRESFTHRNYLYLRNFGQGMGLDWRVTFQTEDKRDVEAYCRRHRIEFEWRSEDRLRTRQVRPVIREHTYTGVPVWFNHCTFFHLSTLPVGIRSQLEGEWSEWDLPNQTFYGDGASIEAHVTERLRNAYLAEKVVFDWQRGDILVLDNMLTAHGREPFNGSRRVLVAMSEATQHTLDRV